MAFNSESSPDWAIYAKPLDTNQVIKVHPATLVEVDHLIKVKQLKTGKNTCVCLYDQTTINDEELKSEYITDVYASEIVEYSRMYQTPCNASVLFQIITNDDDNGMLLNTSNPTNIHVEHNEYSVEIDNPIVQSDQAWNAQKRAEHVGKQVHVTTVLTRDNSPSKIINAGFIKFVGPKSDIKHIIRFKLNDEVIAEDFIEVGEEIDLSAFNTEWLDNKTLVMEIGCLLQVYNLKSGKYTSHPDNVDVTLIQSNITAQYQLDPTLIYSEELELTERSCQNVLGAIEGPPDSDTSVGADISRQIVDEFKKIVDIMGAPYYCALKMNSHDLPDTFTLKYHINTTDECCPNGKVNIKSTSIITHNNIKSPVVADITIKTNVCPITTPNSNPNSHKKIMQRNIFPKREITPKTATAAEGGCGCGKKKPPQSKLNKK